MSFFSKLKAGLQRTKESMVLSMEEMFNTYTKVDEGFLEELEEILILSDVSMNTALKISEELKETVKRRHMDSAEQVREEVRRITAGILDKGAEAHRLTETYPLILLVIGVNGVGKTTSIAKIAAGLKKEGKSVLLVAADTFRAAAAEQLVVWGERIGVNVVRHKEGSDPAAVIFDGIQSAKAKGTDVVICDTAGRLHNKKNLMNELQKMNRIIDREFPEAAKETLLVIDGSTGQNAKSQVKEFSEIADITGIILTKLDGTAKGGIVISIADEFDIPVKYIGVGEGLEDMQPFHPDEFVRALFDNSPAEEESRQQDLPEEEPAMQRQENEHGSDSGILKQEEAEAVPKEAERSEEESLSDQAAGLEEMPAPEGAAPVPEETERFMEEEAQRREEIPEEEMPEPVQSDSAGVPAEETEAQEEPQAEAVSEKDGAPENDRMEKEQENQEQENQGFWSRLFRRKGS